MEGYISEIFMVGSASSVTTKEIYNSYTETMPPPKVELKYPERNWNLVWKRLSNGVLSPTARDKLFYIIHERVPTRE